MSRRSLLALLRGPDGRSIGRGLALLVLVNVLLAGLHGGALAQAAGTGVPAICTLSGPNHDPGYPANDVDHRACCMLGCVAATANILPPALPALADVHPAILADISQLSTTVRVRSHLSDGPAQPRGPPLLD